MCLGNRFGCERMDKRLFQSNARVLVLLLVCVGIGGSNAAVSVWSFFALTEPLANHVRLSLSSD